LDRVKEVLQQSEAATTKQLCVSVLDHMQQFMHTAPMRDDATALALARKP
jgi:hypothetical protein